MSETVVKLEAVLEPLSVERAAVAVSDMFVDGLEELGLSTR